MYSMLLVISELALRAESSVLQHTLTMPQSRLRRYGRQKDLNGRADHGCWRRTEKRMVVLT